MFNENVNAYEQQLHEIGITDKSEQELVLNYLNTLVNIIINKYNLI